MKNSNLISEILNWFKAAKPEPTNKDKLVQIGCHYEEVAEMMVAVIGEKHMGSHAVNNCANGFKGVRDELVDLMQPNNELELLDAICDQIVTSVGVGYMMGFDVEGALKEVIRSNNSKMVDGKFIFDENEKIAKPDSFSEPNLKPFLGDK